MKRYFLFIALIILALVVGSCALNPAEGAPTQIYATPTSYTLFDGGSNKPLPVPGGSFEATAIPTVSNFFDTEAGIIKEPTVPAPTATLVPYNSTVVDPSALDSHIVSIYDNQLNPNWQVLSSERTTYDLANEEYVYAGTKAIKISPQEDFGTTYFTVRSDSTETYPRDKVLGLEFKLNGGKNPIQTKDLGVTVLGSDQYTYFVSGDESVKSSMDPVFSETRLYYLGINDTIPPDTWVNVILWLNEREFDPIYKNVTAFYIKNGEGFQTPYYIDDIHLILSNAQTALTNPEPNAETTQTVFTPNSNAITEVVNVEVDASKNVYPISPMIYGVETTSRDVLLDLRPGLNNWGGTTSTRYNWQLGNASNLGRAGVYKNTDVGLPTTGLDQLLSISRYAGAATRVTLPTLGWVAKNANPNTCSFPLPDGSCGDGGTSTCMEPNEVADPQLANVASNVNTVVEWVNRLASYNYVTIFAMDNEPDMWGITHFDVHPQCTTYDELLQKYLEYAVPVRAAAPKALLAGPVISGWDHYWDSPAGRTDKQQHDNQDLIPWFLDQLKKHDEETGVRSIDVLDIHYFPDGLNNQNIDADTANRRTQAPRALWDQTYKDDESTISDPINLIPRMRYVVNEYYPGLEIGISEWNFGADLNINGAIAIADALGIFGREGVYYASYAGAPPKGSPGAFAFKMYTNYDGSNSRFANTSISAQSDAPDLVTSYASIDERTGQIHLMVINKHPGSNIQVKVSLANVDAVRRTVLYRYSRETLDKIVTSNVDWPEDGMLVVPPYSISHYVITP